MNKNSTILFVTDDAPEKFGGTTTFLARLLGDLKGRGFQLVLLVIADTKGSVGEASRDCAALGIEVSTLARGTMFENVAWILQRTHECKPSVFVAYESPEASYAACQMRRLTGLPTVRIGHTDDAAEARMTRAFCKEAGAGAFSVLVPVSRSLEEKYQAAAGSASRIVRIPYGAPDPGPHLRAQWSEAPFTLVYVGRLLQFQKRIVEVAQAFVEACRRHHHIRCVMIGDGPEGGAVRDIVRAAGMEGQIRLLGRLPAGEVAQVVAGCQVIVLLSDFEGIPVAIMEAMAMGVVPVLLASPNGILELVLHQKTGLLCTDREEGFQAAVSRLAGDEELWRQLSGGAHQHYEAEFSQDRAMAKWAELLRELLAETVVWPLDGSVPLPEFPQSHWSTPWADASMAGKGLQGIKQRAGAIAWKLWKSIPIRLRWTLRDSLKKLGAGRLAS